MASEAYHDWSGEAADAQLRVNFTLKLLLSQNFCNGPLMRFIRFASNIGPAAAVPAGPASAAIFFFWAQFSRKLARLYEYSYLSSVLYMNIHILPMTQSVCHFKRKKKKAMKYPFSVPSPNHNPNYNTKSEPLHHKQLRKTMHTILPNVYRAYLV